MAETTHRIAKADRVGDKPIPDVVISISERIPEGMTLAQSVMFYDKQAEAIVDALVTTLPQAVLVRVLRDLLEIHASSYRGKLEVSEHGD